MRTALLPAFLHKEVRQHLAWFAEKGPDGLLFVGEKGAPFRRTSFGRKWRRARAAVGLPDGFRFYDLRHTGHTPGRSVLREGRADLSALRRGAQRDVAAGPGSSINFLLPLVVGAEALVGLVARAIGRRLALRAPAAVRVSLPTLLMVVATVWLAWWFFATRGTLDGYPGDSHN